MAYTPPYAKQKRYHERKPWVRHVCWARRRCRSLDKRWKTTYHDQGIECPLTGKEAEYLWHRDGAAKMDRPSLDRIETGKPGEKRKHYERDNCRFVEFIENIRAPHVGKEIVDEENPAAEDGPTGDTAYHETDRVAW